MIDWNRIEGFDWDAGNSRKNVEKHGVGQPEAEQVFFNEPLLVVADEHHSTVETRLHALGHSEAGRLLHITFTLRQNLRLIRVISARDMHRKERAIYGQAR
ncbi:BrnT family toxin [Mesorhizobium sp. A623]